MQRWEDDEGEDNEDNSDYGDDSDNPFMFNWKFWYLNFTRR
jgi:hypothetical protein